MKTNQPTNQPSSVIAIRNTIFWGMMSAQADRREMFQQRGKTCSQLQTGDIAKKKGERKGMRKAYEE